MFSFSRLKIAVLLGMISLTASCALLPDMSGPSRSQRMSMVSDDKTALAVQYMNIGDYRAAVSSIDAAINARGNNEMAWMIKGLIYQSLKVPDTADQSFRRALSIAPNSAEINNNYGWFLCTTRNQPQAAIAYFDKALADPTYPTPNLAHLNKGICRGKMGNYAAAAADIARARALNPRHPTPMKEMARIKLMEGNSQQAQELMNKYQSMVEVLGPDDLLLGWKIAKARGDNQAAYEYEAQLRSRYPASDELAQIGGSIGF